MGMETNNSQPLVSIIIPCYNAEAYIAEAIESALSQSYQNCEIIVVDDGSQDLSEHVIKRYYPVVRYLKTDHRGACHARNIGLSVASGERVQWLDADDKLRPTCIEGKLRLCHSENIIPICDVAAMPGGKLAAFWNKPKYNLITALAYGSPPTPAPLHYRANLLAIGGFREDLPCAQEFDLHLRLLIKKKCEFVSTGQIGVDIRSHQGSLSRSVGVNMYYKKLEILESIEFSNKLCSEHIEALAYHRVRVCQQLYRLGHKTESLKVYKQILMEFPNSMQSNYFSNLEGWLLKFMGIQMFEMLRRVAAPIAKKALVR